VLASAALSLTLASHAAAGHGGPHEQPLPDAACNAGTLQARAGAPGAPTEDPRRRIPHRHTLNVGGQLVMGCYHYNDQFPPAVVVS
jgi:hypothetical protein